MIALKEKTVETVKKELETYQNIGILSCGGCPAFQKKGGTVGVENWSAELSKLINIQWTVLTSFLCDERHFQIHLDELADHLEDVDAVAVLSCEMGSHLASETLGYPCFSCLEAQHIGVMKNNGTIKKFGELTWSSN